VGKILEQIGVRNFEEVYSKQADSKPDIMVMHRLGSNE